MVGLQYAHVHTMTSPRPLGPPPGPTTTTTTTAHPPTSPQPARRRLSARRAPSASSLLDDERDPYPASMPRPVLSRAGSSSAGGTGGGGTGTAAGMSPVASLPRDELHRLELLINSYEAEEEAIMHRLARRLEELRRHEVAMSAQMEQESEGMVNRLQRQLRVVQGQLEAARRRGEGTVGEAGNGQGGMPLGTSPVPNVGLQAFLSGSDPVLMGNAVESLRAEKAEMGKRIDSLSNENDALRQELIDLRRRLNIPVDDLVGLRARKTTVNTSISGPAPTSTAYASTGASQPISFHRQPVHSPAHASSTASSSSTAASPPFSASVADTHASSFPSPFSSQAESYLPRPPPNTRASPGATLGFYGSVAPPPGRSYPAGQGGMPLTYPSVPPPSLSTSLASTSAVVSPAGSPTHSRRPSMGRIAEQGSFARGRVESFGVGGQRGRDRPGGPGEALEEEAVED